MRTPGAYRNLSTLLDFRRPGAAFGRKKVATGQSGRQVIGLGYWTVIRLPDYPMTSAAVRSSELASGFQLSRRAVRKRSGLEIDLDFPAVQVSANELFRERIF